MPSLLLPTDVPPAILPAEASLHPLFQTNRLPGCPVTVSDMPTGSIWQQELRVNGFVVGQQVAVVQLAETFTYRCATDSAVLLFALQGRLRFEMNNGVLEYLEEKQYCLISGAADAPIIVSLPEGNLHFFQLSFSIPMLQKLPGAIPSSVVSEKDSTISGVEVSGYRLSVNSGMLQLLKKLLSAGLKTGVYNILLLNETCLKLLKRFTDDRITYYAQQRWVQKKQLSITELVAFLSDHLDADSRFQVTAQACAKRTQLDVSFFKKIFRSHYGVTLSRYLYLQRMQRAFLLISQAGQLPGNVYREVGYQNFSSFSRAFSGYFGQPPSAVVSIHK